MLSEILVAGTVVASVVVFLYQGWALWLAAEMPRLEPAPAPSAKPAAPSVSVIIPARNEELDLPTSLDSVLAQDYPNFEVVVVDGGSTDGTRGIVDARAPRVRRLEEPPLPPGWVGKSWACWTGARATGSEWLLFLDADVRLDPRALRTAVEWAVREDASLASLATEVEMVGFWERTVLPFYIQMVLTYLRAPHVNRPTSRAAMANGQFCLVRRTAYEALGGHEAIRANLLEDVALARRFKSAGRTVRLAFAPALARTRMYRDRTEMFEGIRKTVHGTEFSAAQQVGFVAGLVGLFLLPLAVLPVGLLSGNLAVTVLGAALALALFGKHVVFARAVRAPAAYGLLYPVAVGFYVAVILSSLRRGLRGGSIAWKGRAYPIRPPDASRTAK
jgi:chlorobactene glucosyltransferase